MSAALPASGGVSEERTALPSSTLSALPETTTVTTGFPVSRPLPAWRCEGAARVSLSPAAKSCWCRSARPQGWRQAHAQDDGIRPLRDGDRFAEPVVHFGDGVSRSRKLGPQRVHQPPCPRRMRILQERYVARGDAVVVLRAFWLSALADDGVVLSPPVSSAGSRHFQQRDGRRRLVGRRCASVSEEK